MIQELLHALVQDVLMLLKEHPDFFSRSGSDRKEYSNTFSGAIGEWLSTVEESAFLEGFKKLVHIVNFPDERSRDSGAFIEVFCRYLVVDLVELLDTRPDSFYLQSVPDRLSNIVSDVSADSAFNKALLHVLSVFSLQELNTYIRNFLLQHVPEEKRSLVLVQTAFAPSADMKRGVRQDFSKGLGFSFVQFSTNPTIIGGMRIMENGKLRDASWYGHISALKHIDLNTLQTHG
jgi:hypothetical protein